MVAAAKKPSLRHLLFTAAERRVRGDDWKSIAEDLGYPEDKLVYLTFRYEEQWDKAYDWAEKNLSRETTAEVIHVLRQEMRSDNLKIKLDATKSMLRWNMKMESRRPATARAVKPRVVIKEVEKEVVPAKYEELKARHDELTQMSREEFQKYTNEVWENHPYTVELRNELETINREIDKLQNLTSVPYYGTAIGLLLALGVWLMLLASGMSGEPRSWCSVNPLCGQDQACSTDVSPVGALHATTDQVNGRETNPGDSLDYLAQRRQDAKKTRDPEIKQELNRIDAEKVLRGARF